MTTTVSNGGLIRTLGGISAFSGLLIVLVVEYTAPIIEENRQRAIEQAIFEVIPGATRSHRYQLQGETLLSSTSPAANDTGERVYAGFDDEGKLQGVALEAAAQGYQDTIQILYGYNPQCRCTTGMKVLKHAETPGLGDLILKDPLFLANFDGLDLTLDANATALRNPVITVKHGNKQHPWEVDAISGATISSKAIGKMINLRSAQLLPRLHPLLTTLPEPPHE